MNCGTCNRSVSLSDVVRCTNVFCAARSAKPVEQVVEQPIAPVTESIAVTEPVAQVAVDSEAVAVASGDVTEPSVAAGEHKPETGLGSDSEWSAIADVDVSSSVVAAAPEQNVTISTTSVTTPNQNQSKMFKRR